MFTRRHVQGRRITDENVQITLIGIQEMVLRYGSGKDDIFIMCTELKFKYICSN